MNDMRYSDTTLTHLWVCYSVDGFKYNLHLIKKHYYSYINEQVEYLKEVINFLKNDKLFRVSLIQNLYNDEHLIIEDKFKQYLKDRKKAITRHRVETPTRLVTAPFSRMNEAQRGDLILLDGVLSNIKLEMIISQTGERIEV